MEVSYTLFETELGWMGVAASVAGLRRIMLPRPSQEVVFQLIREDFPKATRDHSFFSDLPQRLKRYLEGEPVSFDDELDLAPATPFRRAVWEATRSIPYGEIRSYSWVAHHIGKPRALRAVGQALGHNPVPIVVPCHRVVNKNGNLGGFGGGLDMKKRLLEIEALFRKRNQKVPR
ncbi:MAG: methylated-DNA--[protein]-cysteine S-methyltransferase [Dehalococcoidia bacterium]